MEGKELEMLTDKKCSKVIERIFENSTSKQHFEFLKEIMRRMGDDTNAFVELFSNPYASHSIETIIELTEICNDEQSEFLLSFFKVNSKIFQI